MKLYEVLDEQSMNEAAQVVIDKCLPYVKQFTLQDVTLLRGLRHTDEAYVIRQPRTDRKPTDTHLFIHQVADQWFNQKFGIPLRSTSVFTAKNHHVADEFGTPYVIFPVGEQWAMYGSRKVQDFTYHINTTIADQLEQKFPEISKRIAATAYPKLEQRPELTDQEKHAIEQVIQEQLDAANYKQLTAEDVKQIGGSTEIMLQCDAYVAVRKRPNQDFSQIIRQRLQQGT